MPSKNAGRLDFQILDSAIMSLTSFLFDHQDSIEEAMDNLCTNPRPVGAVLGETYPNCQRYSYPVKGYRIVYLVRDIDQTITVTAIWRVSGDAFPQEWDAPNSA